ncbi:MAG: hypothetical protein ABFD50_11585 [Smithella sp.]
MSPEAITAIVTGALALIGSIAALVTARVSAGNSATKIELEDLRRRVDELKNELETERSSNDKLRAQITAAEDSVVTAAAEKRDLRLQLDTMKEEIYSRDKQIKQQQSTIKQQELKIKELESRVSEMEALFKKYKINSDGGENDAAD